MKSKKGTVWMVIGMLLISAALVLTIYNRWEDSRAKKFSSEVLNQLESEIPKAQISPLYKLYPDMKMPVKTINGRDYIGVLYVPDLKLKLPVLSKWSYAGLKIAPCRYSGSVYKKNMIIAGHNFRAHFSRLKTLNIGNKIKFTDMDGNIFWYRIIDMEVIPGTDIKAMKKKGEWDMTLFTCTYGGKNRMAIRCKWIQQ